MAENMAEQQDELEMLIRARYPIINVISYEEQRVLAHLHRIAERRGKKIYTWSFNTGIVPCGLTDQSAKKADAATRDPLQALDRVIANIEPAIFVFYDFHPFMNNRNYSVIRRLREAAAALKNSYKTLVLITPSMTLSEDLEKDVTVVDYPLPDIAMIGTLLDQIIADVQGNPQVNVALSEETRELLLQAALGLTLNEAENVFARALVLHSGLSEASVSVVLEEKRQIIRKSGILEYYEARDDFSQIGGLDILKDWLWKRSFAFSDNARAFGLPPPKGALFLGVQGCGKSLCAKAVSAAWNMPLLRFDAGRLFESALGSTEANLRRSLKIAESVSPCILWIDEIEKAFGGAGSSANTDGGTSARIFGTLLTWLAEKTAPVFVIATANNISRLPPELLRKGRFDEIFFVDLPGIEEREEIFRIKIATRGRRPEGFDVTALSLAADGFSGAEIEEAVIAALYDSYYAGHDLAQPELLAAIGSTVPLSRTLGEEITRLREWCSGRARPASSCNAQDSTTSKLEF